MIAEEVGADSFEIVRVTPYPKEYKACTDEAKAEQNSNARPELTAKVDNFGDYDTFFLGYPNWREICRCPCTRSSRAMISPVRR